MFDNLRFAPVLSVAFCLVAGPSVAAPKGIPSSSLAQSLEVWTEGWKADPTSRSTQDKMVGVKLGLEGPLKIEGRAAVRQPVDPHAEKTGTLDWAISASRKRQEDSVVLDVASTGALDPSAHNYTQSFRGALTWTIHEERALTTKLRLASDVAIATDSGVTPAMGPEWVASSRLSEAGAPMRTDLTAQVNYRISPQADPDFAARLELRISSRAR